MDEYVGLKPTDPQSYRYFMEENLFKHVNLKPQNIHMLNGLTKDYEKECRNYEKAIKQAGGVHLFIGGIGSDGHIAFNEPFSSLSSRTRVKTLTEDTIRANSRFFDGDISKVPTTALTVGVGTIMDAAEVLILATGENKAEALHHGIEGAVSHVWTISALQMHPHGIILCDQAAASGLSDSARNYFLDIEKNNF
jgi:glucosamine-6-phosphate deaminase